MSRYLAIAVFALLPGLASANTIWRGNFQTGNLTQWESHQVVSPDRIQVFPLPTPHDGNHFGIKVLVKQGDNPIHASGNRNELVHPVHIPEGSEYYYRWSTMFANDFPAPATWQVFTQWHQQSDSGSPPIEFDINNNRIMLDSNGSAWTLWSAPLVRGVWHDFVVHIKFSNNPNVGFVELWYDGQHVLNKTHYATGAGDYLKQGLYRNNTIQPNGVIYHTGMVQGLTLADVQPQGSGSVATGGPTPTPAPAPAPAPSSSDVVWRGDFSTGNLTQWESHQVVSPDRIQVLSPPAPHDGEQYAIKVTVKQGDNPINASGNRNELVHPIHVPEGSEYYYRWSTMFANDFPAPATWQVFTQWHQQSDFGSPPIEFDINNDRIMLDSNGSAWTLWSAPLVRGVWHDFVVHIKFSDNPNVGFVELWYDGQHVLNKTYYATGAGDYLKQGLYRNNTIQPDGVVYHTGMVQGLTLQSVQPATPTPPSTDRLWTGDFGTGNLSQWTNVQAAAPDRLQLMQPSPQHEDFKYALKVTVKPGDVASGGNRAQVVRGKLEPEGSDSYYRWSTYFPSSYPSVPTWQELVTFENQAETGPAPVELRTIGEQIQFALGPDQKVVWQAPLERGRWLRFIVHVKFSNDPSQGFVELWYDGQPALGKTFGLTQANDYLKLGLSRSPSIQVPSTVYHDGMVQGLTLQSVLPAHTGSGGMTNGSLISSL